MCIWRKRCKQDAYQAVRRDLISDSLDIGTVFPQIFSFVQTVISMKSKNQNLSAGIVSGRQSHNEHGTGFISGLCADGAAVEHHNFMHERKPESNAAHLPAS